MSIGNTGKGLYDLEGNLNEMLFLKAIKDYSRSAVSMGYRKRGGCLGPLQGDSKARIGDFTDNGKIFDMGGSDGYFSIWDSETGRRKIRAKGHDGEVVCFDYIEKEDEDSLWAPEGIDLKRGDAKVLVVLFSFQGI